MTTISVRPVNLVIVQWEMFLLGYTEAINSQCSLHAKLFYVFTGKPIYANLFGLPCAAFMRIQLNVVPSLRL